MTEAEVRALLGYHPDPVAVRRRLLREASELYRWGLASERHQPLLTSLRGQLRKFYLYPTFDCPLRCPYCYAEGGERHTDELGARDFLRITREAIEAGFEGVVIVGGEPLVYREFEQYLDGLCGIDKHECPLVLRTSFGFEVSDDLMARICEAFDEVVVSIDGDEAAHDAVRGKGTWRHATGNALRALELGARVSVNAVMTREQSEGTPGAFLREFCAEHGIGKLVISAPVPMGRAAGTAVPPFEWRSDLRPAESLEPKFSCGLGHSLYMQPDGSVYPCYAWCEKEHQLGDLSTESVADILARGDLLAIANSGVETNEKCRTCEVRYLCGGMCKVYVRDKHDMDSGDFDCAAVKQRLLATLAEWDIA